jgi:hypothetical protein
VANVCRFATLLDKTIAAFSFSENAMWEIR